jgi:hypothetical protein
MYHSTPLDKATFRKDESIPTAATSFDYPVAQQLHQIDQIESFTAKSDLRELPIAAQCFSSRVIRVRCVAFLLACDHL